MQTLKDEVDAVFHAQEKRANERARGIEHDGMNPCDVSPRFIRRTLMSMGPHMDQVAKSELCAVQHSLSSLTSSILSNTLSLDGNVRGGLVRVIDLKDLGTEDDTRPSELFEPSLRSLAQMDAHVFQAAVADMASYASSKPSSLDVSASLSGPDAAIEQTGFDTERNI